MNDSVYSKHPHSHANAAIYFNQSFSNAIECSIYAAACVPWTAAVCVGRRGRMDGWMDVKIRQIDR